ncbi:MAG: alpha/beta hydrolase [Paracoccaceae bacterium]
MLKFKIPLLAVLFTLAACLATPETQLVPEEHRLTVFGTIDGQTPGALRRSVDRNPEVTTLVLQNVPGSVDDDASLTQMARFIRDAGLTTRVPSDGMVASGGVDMLAMGATRVIEPGACVGVHSWAEGGLLGSVAGADLPRTDPAHDLYLSFYEDMGIPESFYWFTLSAAGPDDIHWMSPREINRFQLSTRPLPDVLNETPAQRWARCEARG